MVCFAFFENFVVSFSWKVNMKIHIVIHISPQVPCLTKIRVRELWAKIL